MRTSDYIYLDAATKSSKSFFITDGQAAKSGAHMKSSKHERGEEVISGKSLHKFLTSWYLSMPQFYDIK